MMRLSSAALMLALMGIGLTGCADDEVQEVKMVTRPVKLIKVDGLVASSMRFFPAKVQADRQAELAFRVGGELTKIPLLEGQKVRKGEVLAKLDERDANNVVLLREADYELALADYRRQAQLLDQALISKADFDYASAQLKSAKANLASAKDQLSYTELTAPFNGRVAKRYIDNYQTVQAGAPVLTLHRDDAVDIVIQIAESLVQSVDRDYDHDRFSPHVSFAVKPEKRYPVTFKEFSGQVTQGTQTYDATFTLKLPQDIEVLPGMSAQLSIMIPIELQNAESVVLPMSAIDRRDEDGVSFIWLYDENKQTVYSAPVTLGQVRKDGIEVLTGIKAGHQVVAAGVHHLTEGMQVKPLRWERGV